MPSAMVVAASTSVSAPASTDRCMEGSAAVCTPTTWMRGLHSFIASAMPEISPPPPMGTTTISR